MDQIRFDLGEVHDKADQWWKDCAWRAIETLAASGLPFTSHEVLDLGVPDPDHPNRWGALFRAADAAGLIRPIGYQQSTRPSRHGSVVRVWVGTFGTEDRAA